MNYVGIDTGLGGGIAIIKKDEVIVAKMPVFEKDYDINSIVSLLLDNMPIAKVGIEKVHANPKMARSACFNFGKGLGVLEGLVAALRIPYELIPPKTWQKKMHNGVTGDNTKIKSIKAVNRLYPTLSLKATDRSTKDHDGIADAVMIANYIKNN